MKKIKTIDVTPSWAGILPALLELAKGDVRRQAESVNVARIELFRMAKAADQWNEHCAKNKRKVIK